MISYLAGVVHHRNGNSLTLLVNGVGYLVAVPAGTMLKVKLEENLELNIHTHVREDALDLYGFLTPEELALFELLIGVSGVGPKTALLVIDRGVDAVKQAIIKADEEFFTLVPRLGKKNAQKIIIELKSKLGSLAELDLAKDGGQTGDLIEALLSMGYTRAESVTAIKNIDTAGKNTEEQIREVLRQMNKK